jgi:RNA polymerase primary sigma factor
MSLVINLKTDTATIVDRNENTSRFYDDVKKYPTLSKEEEEKWFSILANGTEEERKYAREYIWLCNQRMVIASAKKWANVDNLTDYINEANIGLAEAIDKFDITKGTKFCTYAMWFIKRAINNYNNDTAPLVRKTNLSKTFHVISKVTNEFIQDNERTPTSDELRECINKKYKTKDIKDKNDLLDIHIARMDDVGGDTDDSNANFSDLMDYNRISSSVNEYEVESNADYNKKLIDSLLKLLNPREQKLIKMRFGLIEINGIKREFELTEIAEELNLTTERVRQLEGETLRKLRKEYGDRINDLL